jgi:hypothetical protein
MFLDKEVPEQYVSDCRRIQEIFRQRCISVSLYESHALWSNYSDNVCASWLMLPEEDADLWTELSNTLGLEEHPKHLDGEVESEF